MPKIVDKSEKRRNIAKSTCNLFIEKGFVNISISQIAQVAGIGKGTVYEYFKNKEDIVFELMGCMLEEYDQELSINLHSTDDIKQKVIYLFNIFLNSDDEKVIMQMTIFKEFLAILLNNPNKELYDFHQNLIQKYILIMNDIINKAVKRGELIPLSLDMVPTIFATMEGFFISQTSKTDMINYINNIFKLLEVK